MLKYKKDTSIIFKWSIPYVWMASAALAMNRVNTNSLCHPHRPHVATHIHITKHNINGIPRIWGPVSLSGLLVPLAEDLLFDNISSSFHGVTGLEQRCSGSDITSKIDPFRFLFSWPVASAFAFGMKETIKEVEDHNYYLYELVHVHVANKHFTWLTSTSSVP